MRAELIATPQFDAKIADLLAADELASLEYAIATAPAVNPIIPGSGGVRKMRWAWARMANATQESLTNDQKNATRKLAESFEKEIEAERGSKA